MIDKPSLDDQYWRALREKSELAGITLDASISPRDFTSYGDRLAGRVMDTLHEFGTTPLSASTVVDVGCGMGRISRPFAAHFHRVIGIDINGRILNAAREYCRDATNIDFVENDGRTLPLDDDSVDYAYSGGVLQHIKELEVIKGYFREGIRVLKPNGTLLYSIMTWMNDIAKGANVGKMLRHSDIEDAIADCDVRVAALLEDPLDPIPHMLIVLQKGPFDAPQERPLFRREMVLSRPYRTGIWEDLGSYEVFRKLWQGKRREVTFWG